MLNKKFNKRTESWSIILVLFSQDLPYLIIRIIILAKGAGFVVHTLLFFTLKNAFMIVVHCYKLRTFYMEYREIKNCLHEFEQHKQDKVETTDNAAVKKVPLFALKSPEKKVEEVKEIN